MKDITHKDNVALPNSQHTIENNTTNALSQNPSAEDELQSFVTCHHYIGNSGKSSSPAHWHKEIEIMHFLSGEGFTHICQCKSVTFDAPAIVIVPSNSIHRTCYPAHCKVNRTLFTTDRIRLHEGDVALDKSLTILGNSSIKGSIVITKENDGFDKLSNILTLLENLSDKPGEKTFDPAQAQDSAIEQDKVDAFVAATFANIGSKDSQRSQLTTAQQANYLDSAYRNNAINAGSIAIASAQNFEPKNESVNANNSSNSKDRAKNRMDLIEQKDFRTLGLTLQFKGYLINVIGILFEYGYLVESTNNRRHRSTRSNDTKVKELLKFIHDNYNSQMNISDLASKMEVTNQYFCRFFKLLTDMSFIDYLNDLRLQKAALEIASTQQSIREISSRHGFDTIGYFFKLFREHYHTTPMGYRNRFLGIDEQGNSDLSDLSAKNKYYHDSQGNPQPIPSVVAKDLKESIDQTRTIQRYRRVDFDK